MEVLSAVRHLDWQAAAALLLAAVVVMGSPGPSTLGVTAVGASFGLRRSLGYAAGAIAGTCAALLLVATGVLALVNSVPHGTPILAGVATAYVAYLAFRVATAPPLQVARTDTEAPSFAGGFLLSVANPKAYLAIGAVFSGATLVRGSTAADALVKIVLLAVMIALIHGIWLWAGVALSRFLRDARTARLINLAMAALLLGATLLGLFG
jgi:threonine/homoserine/homoserine lactone efflux protein